MLEPQIKKLHDLPLLLDIYGGLLTEKQRAALSLFYEEDFTLAEIAAAHGSSRQAAHNLIERGEALLREYESILHIVQQERDRTAAYDELLKAVRSSLPEGSARTKIEEMICRL